MRAAIAEDIVRLSSLRTVDASSTTATESISSLRSDLDVSRGTLNAFIEKPPKGMDGSIVLKLRSLLEQQDKLLRDFESRYKALEKPLTYDPSEDLSLPNKTEEIASRARTASMNLSKIAANPNIRLQSATADRSFSLNNGMLILNQPSIASLDSVAACLDQIATTASGRSDQLSELIKGCDRDYMETRRQLYILVLNGFSGQDGDNLINGYRELLAMLDKQSL